jgi:hypothetical protein
MSAMEITFKVSKDQRDRIHLHSGKDVWITVSPDPKSANYGGHAYERLLALLNTQGCASYARLQAQHGVLPR